MIRMVEKWDMCLIDSNVDLSSSLREEFSKLEEQILACGSCELHETVTNKVIGKGSLSPKIIFIGEGPGKREDETGVPFCGRAGKNLDVMIDYMDLCEEDWGVINTVKCRPPNNRAPKKVEINSCKPFLEKQIELLDPNVIILLGNTAERAFCPDHKLEWGVPEEINGRIILKLYHPAALIYTRSRIETQNEYIDQNRHLFE